MYPQGHIVGSKCVCTMPLFTQPPPPFHPTGATALSAHSLLRLFGCASGYFISLCRGRIGGNGRISISHDGALRPKNNVGRLLCCTALVSGPQGGVWRLWWAGDCSGA